MLKRITIIGCAGGGKATLAARLGSLLELPVHHLDRYAPKPGQSTPRGARAPHEELIAQEQWILHGSLGKAMEDALHAADTIVFLDRRPIGCVCRVLGRRMFGRRKVGPEAPPEGLDLNFLRWIWGYRREDRPNILRKLEGLPKGKKAVILSSRRAMAEFMKAIKTSAPAVK